MNLQHSPVRINLLPFSGYESIDLSEFMELRPLARFINLGFWTMDDLRGLTKSNVEFGIVRLEQKAELI